ncbi:MAG: prepilin-type N-terminal cleavage/methylation domain-containing protein [Candidatus Methylacidiphilales bacterium]|nr:prepilin-type N-terminal cleavage/methylation domain-containing protein [Candidatus Methylacidiphilales bacterium]
MRKRALGFTLIELMVAVVVFVVLGMIIAQVTALTGSAIRESNRRMDAVNQARVALDRFTLDLLQMSRDPRSLYQVDKLPGNDGLSFYAEVPAYSGRRRVSFVNYRVQTDAATSRLRLERGLTGTDWEATGGSKPLNVSSVETVGANDFGILGESVFRVEYAFVMKADGSLVASPGPNFAQVGAMIVTVAAMDPESAKLVTPAQWNSLVAALTDAVDGQFPLKAWTDQVGTAGFLALAAKNATASVRIFQRSIVLNP